MRADVFATAVDRFGEYIYNRSRAPTDYELLEFFNSDIVYGPYSDDEGVDEIDALELEAAMKDEANAAAMAKLRMIREHFYVQTSSREPKLGTWAIFNLKQPKNGGYSDKQEVNQEKTLTIKFEGVGADAGK